MSANPINIKALLAAQKTEILTEVDNKITQVITTSQQNNTAIAESKQALLEALTTGNNGLIGELDENQQAINAVLAALAGTDSDLKADIARAIADIDTAKNTVLNSDKFTVEQVIDRSDAVIDRFAPTEATSGYVQGLNYSGSGRITNITMRQNCGVRVIADGKKVLESPKSYSTTANQTIVNTASSNKVQGIGFNKSISIEYDYGGTGSSPFVNVYGGFYS